MGLNLTPSIAKVYLFGSWLYNKDLARDIDLLIVHRDTSLESCNLAIKIKNYLVLKVRNADICLLSEPEEHQLKFIQKSSARYIGYISIENIESDLAKIVGTLDFSESSGQQDH